MANTKKATKKVEKKAVTKKVAARGNSSNKKYIFAGFLLGLLVATLFFGVYLVLWLIIK